jgi:hypothetical protein
MFFMKDRIINRCMKKVYDDDTRFSEWPLGMSDRYLLKRQIMELARTRAPGEIPGVINGSLPTFYHDFGMKGLDKKAYGKHIMPEDD